MVRASFDTDGLRSAADRIEQTADTLRDIQSALSRLPTGACPRIVDHALDEMARNGRDMIRDIGDEATDLGHKMRQAAQVYDGLENSMMRYFRSGL
jgi:excreted virulence factor EspC (type VII ESX diderm)